MATTKVRLSTSASSRAPQNLRPTPTHDDIRIWHTTHVGRWWDNDGFRPSPLAAFFFFFFPGYRDVCTMSASTPISPLVRQSPRLIFCTLIVLTCSKVLLMPSYRSTDFDVHRNWLALTRHLPSVEDWYFDNASNTTVHTLDYPPSFAFFEYFLSTNPLTNWLLHAGLVEERCLQQLPDTDNAVSTACVVFHRSTVILSDVVLYWGAWVASSGSGTTRHHQYTTFLLLILNPGLLWLDHVHFQYNGMMLGLLLASVGYLERGMRSAEATPNILLAAALYSLLLTFKHLYLPLAPLYFVFLLRHYCMIETEIEGGREKVKVSFSLGRFLSLATVTLSTLLLPFLPFCTRTQMQQLFSRLFPFERGLVHNYWAANIWAIYVFVDKMTRFLTARVMSGATMSLPDVPASIAAICLLGSLLPALCYATAKKSREKFTHMVVYCSLSSFMFAYHVHEKAILTTLLPMTLLVFRDDDGTSMRWKRLFLRTSALGLFGLWPLLFRPIELLMKVSSYACYMSFCVYVLQPEESHRKTALLTTLDYCGTAILSVVALFLEVLHPILLYPAMEFLPLLLTSITCAFGLIVCWISSYRFMTR